MANWVHCRQTIDSHNGNREFPRLPSGVLGPGLMDKFRAQSLRFGTRITGEAVQKTDLSCRILEGIRGARIDRLQIWILSSLVQAQCASVLKGSRRTGRAGFLDMHSDGSPEKQAIGSFIRGKLRTFVQAFGIRLLRNLKIARL